MATVAIKTPCTAAFNGSHRPTFSMSDTGWNVTTAQSLEVQPFGAAMSPPAKCIPWRQLQSLSHFGADALLRKGRSVALAFTAGVP
jgi:hypothetical protein